MIEAYLDNSATTQVDERVAKAALWAMCENYGNPSSLHDKGLNAELAIKASREQLAEALGASGDDIIFTSGGTEANNLAILGTAAAGAKRGGKIITTAFEHSSVLKSFAELERLGCKAVYIKPDCKGHIASEDILAEVDEHTVLVSVMLVNNEIGTILPIEQLVQGIRLKNKKTIIHCDAVQGFGKLPINVKKLGVDLLTVSGHKIHAPKGVGALYLAKAVHLTPRSFGGGQERGLRTGTQAVPVIIAMGCAAALINTRQAQQNSSVLSNALISGIADIHEVIINSPPDALPSIVNLSVMGIRSEIMLHYMSTRGVFVSSGSACAKGGKSHVLTSMGLNPKVIDSALRISFGKFNTCEDVARFITVLKQGIREIKKL
ncbi:MAG: cysteine desulfurase family protein [Hydrogenoanaerobacterium sp.]